LDATLNKYQIGKKFKKKEGVKRRRTTEEDTERERDK
jgi:hypothetical protein